MSCFDGAEVVQMLFVGEDGDAFRLPMVPPRVSEVQVGGLWDGEARAGERGRDLLAIPVVVTQRRPAVLQRLRHGLDSRSPPAGAYARLQLHAEQQHPPDDRLLTVLA